MKKLLSLLLSFCMIIGVCMFGGTVASALKSGDYQYKVKKDGTVEITAYLGNEKNIAIPETLGGKTVTSIAEEFGELIEQDTISIVIPDNVTSIGCMFLAYIDSLEYVDLGDGITEIPELAFRGCGNLKTVIYPKNLKSIGAGAFSECGALTLENPVPNGVKIIGDSAFYKCYSIDNITIPATVKSIGADAFETTGYANNADNWEGKMLYIDNCLVSVKSDITGAVNVKEGTRIVSSYAFSFKRITKATIPDSVTYLGYGAFTYCEKLKEISLGKGITKINSDTFSSCEKLVSVTLPEGVTSIGYNAFAFCYNLKSVQLPKSLTRIDYNAFYDCNKLKVSLPKNLEKIDSQAFSYCSALEKVTIPASIKIIRDDAFYGCKSLQKITVNKNNKYYSAKDGVLYNKEKTKLILYPSAKKGTTYKALKSTKTIVENAFSNCKHLKTVELQKGVNKINKLAFNGGKLKNINVDNKNKTYSSEKGVLYNKQKTKLVRFLDGGKVKNYTVKSGVKTIDEYAFGYCKTLKNIVLSNTVKTIKYGAFNECRKLKSVVIPASVKKIDLYALEEFGYYNTIAYVQKGSYAEKYVKGECDVRYSYEKLSVKQPSFSLEPDNKKIKIKYNSPDKTKGFQIKYKCNDGKWNSNVFKTDKLATKTISNLKKGTYYVKIRSYTVSGNAKYFSKWTDVKTVKVK